MSPLQESIIKYLDERREKVTSYKLAKIFNVDPIQCDKAVNSVTLSGLIKKDVGSRFTLYSLNVDENGDIVWNDEYRAIRDVLSKAEEPLSPSEISKRSSVGIRRAGVILKNLCVLGYADYKSRVVAVKKEYFFFE